MNNLIFFYLKRCPFCKKADQMLESLLQEEKYSSIQVEKVEESKQPIFANNFDYYYVPCFFVGQQKLHEGEINEAELRQVLESTLSINNSL